MRANSMEGRMSQEKLCVVQWKKFYKDGGSVLAGYSLHNTPEDADHFIKNIAPVFHRAAGKDIKIAPHGPLIQGGHFLIELESEKSQITQELKRQLGSAKGLRLSEDESTALRKHLNNQPLHTWQRRGGRTSLTANRTRLVL